ncbi:MAG: ThuA domain-containing protein [Verrucomicrobiia bacterium]|jgi:type 1 glutamine amidotransferase
MKSLICLPILLVALVGCSQIPEEAAPLKILQLAGGCCHDYENQKVVIAEGLKLRFDCEVDTVHEGDDRDYELSIFKQDNWAADYDVVLFNICYGHVKNEAMILDVVDQATREKKGIVALHCSAHSYRETTEGTAAWRAMLGVSSRKHEKRHPVKVSNRNSSHPIMKDFPKTWDIPQEEVYIIFDRAEGIEVLGDTYGPETEATHPVIWTNEYREARVFGTTLGHFTETMAEEVYLDLIANGTLWSVGKL